MNLREAHVFAHGFSTGRDPFFVEGIDRGPVDNVTTVHSTADGWAIGYRELGQVTVRDTYTDEADAAEAFLDALARVGRIPEDWRRNR